MSKYLTVLLLLGLLWVGCGEPSSPSGARIGPVDFYKCRGDTVPCYPEHLIYRPVLGMPFLVYAKAPGALVMEEQISYPQTGTDVPGFVRFTHLPREDSVYTVWALPAPADAAAWYEYKLTLPWTRPSVLDSFVVRWTYP